MIIRKALQSDIVALGKFYDEQVRWMDENECNFPKWTYKGYPTESTVRWTIGEGTQFLCVEGDEIVGAFVLNTDPMGAYDRVHWSRPFKQGEYLIIHMLVTSHQHLGEGIGKAMTEYCIAAAKNNNFLGIRLDVVPGNIPAVRLYEKCGFHFLEEADLERGVEKIPTFLMFECDF